MSTFVLGRLQVVGRAHHEPILDAEVRDAVILVREPSNPYDSHAIRVDHACDGTLGHIARHLACLLAPIMDNGYQVTARIAAIEFDDVSIELRMEAKMPGRAQG
jgi:hypothetical protein